MQIYDGRDDKKVAPTRHTAAVVSANQIICGDNDQMTLRRNGREDWSLFYCESGRLYFGEGVLNAGQVWICPPGVPQKYTAYGKDRTVYRYLHFTGSDIRELLSSLEIVLSGPITVKGSLSGIFDNIQSSMAQDNALMRLSAEYHTLHLISKLSGLCASVPEAFMMKRVTDDMRHSFAAEYDAGRYAAMLGVGVSRFNHLFRQCEGISPYAYFIGLRMANACGLLEETDLKIQDIAEKCGYKDAMYFTQAFKKNIGVTPSEYRKTNRTFG